MTEHVVIPPEALCEAYREAAKLAAEDRYGDEDYPMPAEEVGQVFDALDRIVISTLRKQGCARVLAKLLCSAARAVALGSEDES